MLRLLPTPYGGAEGPFTHGDSQEPPRPRGRIGSHQPEHVGHRRVNENADGGTHWCVVEGIHL
jgi:hypothetical protein